MLATSSCEACRISGRSLTLPGLYTPCTLPNDAATENRPMGLQGVVGQQHVAGLGVQLGVVGALVELATPMPSSSPPVTPSSISRFMSSLAIRCSTRAHSPMFHSSGSSDRSSMCDVNSGWPVWAKNSSPWSSMPSTHGMSFLLA